jgi:hypothetical protein
MSLYTPFEMQQQQPPSYVSCPFHKYIAPGQSTFTVSVPKPFLTYYLPLNQTVQKRSFFFGSLRLVPDFFSRDAQFFELDTEDDLDTKTTNQFNLLYKISPSIFIAAATGNTDAGWEFEIKSNNLEDNKIETFFDTVNKYTESSKPAGFVSAPFFFDWTTEDFEMSQEGEQSELKLNIDEYIRSFAEEFYKETVDVSSTHYNSLQPTQRKVALANNWAFPKLAYTEPSVLQMIRVRLAVAPNTKVLFSAKKMLQLLGFTPEKRILHKYEFSNPSKNSYLYFVAEEPPTLNMFNYGRINAAPFSSVVVTPVQNVTMSVQERRSNATVYKHLKKSLDSLAEQTNIDFNLEYDVDSETFKFVFPNNPAIKTVFFCDNELSSRLGFGLKREVTEENVARAVPNPVVKESAKKSKILSFDTGHVIVTCFNTSSNLTSISNNQYMASLLADNAGMMTISPCVGEVSSFVPPNFEQDGNNNVPLLCNLLKFNDAGDLVPFQWKTGAYVSGVLQGKL